VTRTAPCFFVSDLHGRAERYRKLRAAVERERPAALFLGGDLLPFALAPGPDDSEAAGGFIPGHLAAGFERLRELLGADYPRVFLILGNDDPRAEEEEILAGAARGLWEYLHERQASFGEFHVFGYACVPPTPFQLKDWERYDVSRFVDPGAVPPEEGRRSVPVPLRDILHGTIDGDLKRLAGPADLSRSIFLFHAPPYDTGLDRAALDGRSIDHVPLDVHVGSIAVRRFIEARRPLLTLHGHVHESARLTGCWKERIGETWALSAAHDGPELALVRFDPGDPAGAARELI
jgi:uncharacterized protein